jgi:hypothetical protein
MDSDSDSDDDKTSDYTWVLPILLLGVTAQRQEQPQGLGRLYTGQEYVDNVLNCGNSIRIRDILRMELNTFYQLRDWLTSNTKLDDSRYVSIEEKLFIFIYIASSGQSNRKAQEQFNRSSWTISQLVFNLVLLLL